MSKENGKPGPAPGDRGRASLLTADLQKKICEWIEKGNTYTRACALTDISERIFYLWKAQGEKDEQAGIESIHFHFLQAIKKSREQFKATLVQNIMDAGEDKTHWQANAWLLERLFHKEFGRKDSLKVQGNFNVRNFDLELTPEEQTAYQERMAAVFGDDIKDMMGADIGEQDD